MFAKIKKFRLSAKIAASKEAVEAYRKYMGGIADYSGIPTHECICGCNVFKIVAAFEDYEIAWHSLVGYCYGCGAKVTVPCEIDRPEESYVTV